MQIVHPENTKNEKKLFTILKKTSLVCVCEREREGDGGYAHAGRLDMSAETAQGIPKLERAPLMIPHGK